MARRTLLLATTLALLIALPAPAAANHRQFQWDSLQAFVHKGGSEWWVETKLIGYASNPIVRVQARDDNSPWKDLSLKSWGNWAGSFHIEPGNRVHFRAYSSEDAVTYSCAFTHPTGQENCRFSSDTFYSDPAGEADFDHLGGSTTSVTVRVEHMDGFGFDLSGTYARVEGSDTWHTLRETATPGVWTGPIDNPLNKRVQFESYRAGGMSDAWRERSCWFTHPEGDEKCSAGPGPGMEAAYRSIKGNEYWVELKVDASKTLAGVDVRVNDDGAWKPLTKRSWGAWAAGLHVPAGSIIEFRARATDGSWDLSDNAWNWPSATPVATGAGFTVQFRNVAGNSEWIQVNTVSNRPVIGLLVEVEGGYSDPLFERSWGDWARARHFEEGQRVRFYAYTLEGEAATSEWMTWPPG